MHLPSTLADLGARARMAHRSAASPTREMPLCVGGSSPLLLLLLALLAARDASACETCSQCDSYDYFDAVDAEPHLSPGHTRSVFVPHSHALIAPDSRVYGAPPPGWSGSLTAAAVVTPALGAHFSMYLVNASASAILPQPVTFPSAPSNLERLIYVLLGALSVTNGSVLTSLTPGSFVYVAPHDQSLSIDVPTEAHFVQIDRVNTVKNTPPSVIGSEGDIHPEPVAGEVFELRRLLDPSNPAYDFNIHIMDFHPGEYLNVKEVHYNQHGLLMLQGQGIYRLSDSYFHVAAGDVIYLAPFVLQWYAALGTQPTRYFLYKDTNADPLLHNHYQSAVIE
ncbi:RmlC-like cupin [Gracilaria domingensis]|nr:RmlC-like cupin [Gracilaria domingensis]